MFSFFQKNPPFGGKIPSFFFFHCQAVFLAESHISICHWFFNPSAYHQCFSRGETFSFRGNNLWPFLKLFHSQTFSYPRILLPAIFFQLKFSFFFFLNTHTEIKRKIWTVIAFVLISSPITSFLPCQIKGLHGLAVYLAGFGLMVGHNGLRDVFQP